MLTLFLGLLLVVRLIMMASPSSPSDHGSSVTGGGSLLRHHHGTRIPPSATAAATFQCPLTPSDQVADNFDPDRFRNAYLGKDNAKDLEQFIQDFRDKPYDDWQLPYNHMKNGMTPWKSKYYPPNIQNGDAIYESAMGIGLNMLMTLEILQQVTNNGIHSLTIHGNEYLQESTAKANVFLERVAPKGVTKGTICAADSTNLDHVPSNAFDLVFTGYVS